MNFIKAIKNALSQKERNILLIVFAVFTISLVARVSLAVQENSKYIAIQGGIFNEGHVGQPTAINPIISNNQIDQDISSLIYSRLFDLVQTYEEKENGKIYSLKLKEGLVWSDGKPLTSDDVIFTIETIQNPEINSPLAKNWQGVAAERISELQVQIALPIPYAFFENNLKRLPVLPQHIFGTIPSTNIRLSNYNLEPVSSGPYVFSDYSKRKDGFITQYHLKINENYQNSKPFIKDFYFKFFENTDGLYNAFRLRKIDGFGSLNPISENIASSKMIVNEITMPRYYAIFFNQNINPFLKNDEFRRALGLAINKDRIVSEVLKNKAKKINGPIIPELVDLKDNTKKNQYNPEEARRIINSLNKENMVLNLIVPEVDFLKNTAEIIKENWISIGISEVNLFVLKPDDLLDNVLKPNNYEMILFGNILENPEDLFSFWHSSQRFYPGLNLSLYQNSKVDNLIESIRQTKDKNTRREELDLAQSLILEDMPAVFLYSLPYTYTLVDNGSSIAFTDDTYLTTPADRFNEINQWYVTSVRVLK